MLKEVINSIIEAEKKAEAVIAEAQSDCGKIIAEAEERAGRLAAEATEDAKKSIKKSKEDGNSIASEAGQKSVEAGTKELGIKEREYAKNLDKAVKTIVEELVKKWQ